MLVVMCRLPNRFFQRMGVFAIYFTICFFALIVRGYYRVPQSCIMHEIIDKEENTVKSIIADRFECKCHYTNFFRSKNSHDQTNFTSLNFISNVTSFERQFEPLGLVSSIKYLIFDNLFEMENIFLHSRP